MKKVIITLIFIMALCCSIAQELPIASCQDIIENVNPTYSKAKELKAVMEELTKLGVPGIAMAVHTQEGWWTGSAGYAKIETKTPMEPCHLQYLQSIAKTYMAVAILKLTEQGKIDIDQSITKYLPSRLSVYITGAENITVRMLLNHTSGIPEYNSAPKYISYLLQHPDHYFAPEDYLSYIEGKPLDFAPGSKYSYRNTNYVILSLIADALTGDHAKFITETIFKPLHLTNTFYRAEDGYLTYPTLVNSYWDRHSNGIIENTSLLQRNNVLAMVGDDGIVATPIEAVKFLKGLMENELISTSTLEVMKTWANDSKGNPMYGLGLDYTTLRGQKAYGHSGGGIGAGCQLYYFPEQKIYMFIAINLGTVTDSPITTTAAETLENLYEIILK